MLEDFAALSRQLGDRYLIERELGRGGMGTVYLARDRRLDRPVALKVLPPEFAVVADLRERFLRETRLAAGFSHPNIVPVFAIEEADELLAFAMGFVEGESLAGRVARDGPLSGRDVVRVMTDVGYALAYAHGRGVVHRDIKPDNIMIERATGRALVMDFGIARAITPVADKPGLTRVGEVVGTPEYMSPEQATGDTVDGRADLYSLGLVAWFAATGETAMTGTNTQRILVRQLTEAVPPLGTRRPDLPARLCEVVDRCCAKDAADRFANAEALVEALDAAQLAAPEIPVAIRLLAPELTGAMTGGMSAVAMLLVGSSMIASNGNGNVFAIGVIFAATAWVRLLTALREVRRLCASGYDVDSIQGFLRQTLTERDDERARRASDPQLTARRRRRVLVAIGLLIWQGATVITLRVQQGTNDIQLRGGSVVLVTFFASLLGSAAAIAILLTSPFRRSLSEQAFSMVWLGGIGRWVMRLATARGATPAPVRSVLPPPPIATPRPITAPRAAAVSAPAAVPSGVADLAAVAHDVAQLQRRVAALEQRHDA